MFHWIPYAFVRIVLFFAIGILLGINFPDIINTEMATILLIVLCATYLLLNTLRKRLPFAGVIAFCAVSTAGFVNVQWHDASSDTSHLINSRESFDLYKAVITQPPKESAKRWKCEALIQSIRTQHGWVTRTGKAILYLSKKMDFEAPVYGDVFLVKGNPQSVPDPANPGEFDYRTFLRYKQIYYQHFTNENGVLLLYNQPPDRFLQHAITARLWADGVLKKYVTGDRSYALASALVLGVTDGLDNDLMNAYAASGAMHVLSVSGLHVGIVYWLLTLLLSPLQKWRWGKWVMLGISLTTLWSYAFITGISASVLRAVAMFSFAVIARTWNHRSNIYNILAASAFCLLLYDPFMLMSVGFQLSYIAVIGIVAMQPGLYQLWEPKHRVWDEIWKVAAVSIAAQLATMSISLYYFHQFPNYFLLTNLFVIPGSFGVLMMGIALIAFNFIGLLAEWIGYALHLVISLLNGMVFGVEKLPFSVMNNIHINTLQCWIGMLLVVFMFMWARSKQFKWLVSGAVACSFYAFASWMHFFQTVQSDSITIYSIRGSTAIDLSSDGRTQFIGDTTLTDVSPVTRFHILPNRLLTGSTTLVTDHSNIYSTAGCKIVSWRKRSILCIMDRNYQVPPNASFDLVVLCNNAVNELKKITQQVKASQYIVDSSNSYSRSASLLQESSLLKVDLISVLHHGAYQKTF